MSVRTGLVTPPPHTHPPIASQQIREGFKSDKTEAQLLLNGKIPKIKSSQRVKSPLPTNMSSSIHPSIHPLINPSTHPSATFVPPSSPASAAGGKRQCATSDRTRLRWFWNHHRTTKFTTTTRLPLHRCVVPRMRGAALECTSPVFFPPKLFFQHGLFLSAGGCAGHKFSTSGSLSGWMVCLKRGEDLNRPTSFLLFALFFSLETTSTDD